MIVGCGIKDKSCCPCLSVNLSLSQFPFLLYCRLYPQESEHRLYKWTSETISKSLKVRVATGASGYEYLRKGMSSKCVFFISHICILLTDRKTLNFMKMSLHNLEMKFPMPSYRTINRPLEAVKFQPGIQYDILDLMALKLQNLPPGGRLAVLKVP